MKPETKAKLRKAWETTKEFLSCLWWAIEHAPEAEMAYHRSKHTCPNCGHDLSSPPLFPR